MRPGRSASPARCCRARRRSISCCATGSGSGPVMDDDCPALDFYGGFYLQPDDDRDLRQARNDPARGSAAAAGSSSSGLLVPQHEAGQALSPAFLDISPLRDCSAPRGAAPYERRAFIFFRIYSMPFADLGLSDQLLRAVADSGYDAPTPIQKGGDPVGADGQGSDRHRPDRHRQDRRLRPADDRHPRRRPQPRAHAALADPRADPRAGRAGRREFREIRQISQALDGAADRRRADGRPGQGARKGRRRADRHARAG